MINRTFLAAAALVVLGSAVRADDKKPRTLGPDDLKALSWRSVGPANMGGRVADIALAPGNPKTFFVALACGGLWKTTNRGTTFAPVFDNEATSSIGSVVVADAPADWDGWKDEKDLDKAKIAELGKAKIVWVGTGEGNGRNSSSWGNGVYRSTDGGASFKSVGLEDSFDIPRLAVDPKNPNVCYAAALGHLWGPNKTRGVYKTTDGGKHWKASLQIDDKTGAIDVVLDPAHPSTVYAAMYHRLRTPSSFESGGTEGGIYRSKDGGDHWEKLSKGLPAQTGRIGLDVFAGDSKVVMAVVESDAGGGASIDEARSRQGGVFRSEDGGDTWARVNPQTPRAFYFSKVRIDPKDSRRVYLLAYDLWGSTDGGKTFVSGLVDKLHGDWHAMAIDPSDPTHLVIGSDGGLYQSDDRGESWDFLNTMAIGQFYNIAVDMSEPYRISGGLQDNGSWVGPSATLFESGNTAILNGDWRSIGGGDGFHVAFDPQNTNVVYTESQGGGLIRLNLATNEVKGLMPVPKEGQPAFRFNWNTPFFVSAHDPSALYMGGNRVFKLTDRGDAWNAISPDLTTADPAKMVTTGSNAETHCTVVSLAESPIAKGTLWAGSDDGRVNMTTDEGAHWSDVTPKMVDGKYIAKIEASHHKAGTAYVAVDGHRSEDYEPHVLMTDDGGRSWKDITGDLPKGASVRSIREDLKSPEVLYAGTETSIFVSMDRGGHWIKLNTGSLPTVGVHDILEHPRTMDLVAGTHGRSIWVMDDASPISQLTKKVVESPLFAFEPLPAKVTMTGWLDGAWGDKYFHGSNPAHGAAISYWCRDRAEGGASIKIEDEKGTILVTLSGSANPGINRIRWDFLPDAKRRLQNRGEDPGQTFAPAGKYKITITVGAEKATTTLTVLPSPVVK